MFIVLAREDLIMKLPIRFSVVLLLLAATSGPALAACGESKRIHASRVPCLDAGYTNHGTVYPRWRAWARNQCSTRGKIVAKVVFENAKSIQWTLNNSAKQYRSGPGYTKGVYYCKDLSDPATLGNPGQIVTK